MSSLLPSPSTRRGKPTPQTPLLRLPSLFPLLLLLLLLLLLTLAAAPSHAFVYRTTLTASQYPAAYAAAHPTTALAIHGLYDACVNANDPNATNINRGALTIYSANMSSVLAEVVPTGQVYLGGFYVPEMGSLDGWCWDDGKSTACPGLFCTGPTCTRVENTSIPLNWAPGYPKMEAGTNAIGTLKYMAYDASLKGWINVDGTAALDGVACQSSDPIIDLESKKKKFPWWAILIIVLGCVVVIALVIVVVVCCCCRKKKRYTDDDDGNESAFTSRSGSFSSRGTSRTGSSYSGTSASSSSFSSRGSSKSSGSSRSSPASSRSSGTGSTSTGTFSTRSSSTASSAFTGSSTTSSANSSSRGSSNRSDSTGRTGSSSSSSSSRAGSSTTGSSITGSSSAASSSRASSPTGSSVTGSSTTGSSSRGSS